MRRPGVWTWILGAALAPTFAPAADPPAGPTPAPTPTPTPAEETLLKALAANPATAPYRIATVRRNGRLILTGRVGTKMAHDVAVRIAIAQGVRFDDSLVIDTAAPVRLATPAQPSGLPAAGTSPYPGTMAGPLGGFGQMTNTFPYPPSTYGLAAAGPGFLYPPPLFGRYDDPFWGFEPPVASFPPWWGAMSARRLAEDGPPPGQVAQQQPNTQQQPQGAGAAVAKPELSPSGAPGSVTMDVDPRGVATLTGEVQSDADREAVAQKVSQLAGITQVINQLAVRDAGLPAAAEAPSDTPPPLPMPPIDPPTPQPLPRPREEPSIEVDASKGGQGVVSESVGRLPQALARRPALIGLPIRVALRDGVARLTGKVPTAYEAMLAFRAAQQEPGVREVDDRLEFAVPDGDKPNPLLKKGRPDDLEPYFEAQIRRQVGDQAHLDRVRVQGDRLEVRGTVPEAADRPRVEAILRSMPLLRGFQLAYDFHAD